MFAVFVRPLSENGHLSCLPDFVLLSKAAVDMDVQYLLTYPLSFFFGDMRIQNEIVSGDGNSLSNLSYFHSDCTVSHFH